MDSFGSALRWRRLPAIVEIVSIGIGYGLYSLVRLIAPNTAATAHAYTVLDIEKALGIFHEISLNAALVGHHWLIEFCSYYYATAHFVVTPIVLGWLWLRHAWAYAMMRSAIVLATVCALVVYATWPLAPPRLVLSGVTDTVMDNPVIWAKEGAAEFVNEYAAMPSLHVGWAVWCAIVVVAVLRSRWRHLAWLYPITTTLVVAATANHYFLDAIGGTVCVLVPLWLCGLRPSHLLRADALVPELEQDLLDADLADA